MSKTKKKTIKYGGREYVAVSHENGAVVIYDDEGDTFCTMPKNPTDAIHLRSWAYNAGVAHGKNLKAMEIRNAIGVEAAMSGKGEE